MGCKARGQPGQPFDHKNGHGYVKAHRGFYHDAIFVKRNNFNLLLHETFGGGFSPTAVLNLRRLARKRKKENGQPKGGMGERHATTIRSHLATLSARLARA